MLKFQGRIITQGTFKFVYEIGFRYLLFDSGKDSESKSFVIFT